MREVGEIHETTDGFEWRLKNFLNIQEKYYDGSSPCFSYNGMEWYFRIYIDREGDNGYIDLGLCKHHVDPISISFSLSLKTVNGDKHVERHHTENFEQGWDYEFNTEFISMSELKRKKAELLPLGILTVVFSPEIPKSASEGDHAVPGCSYRKRNLDNETTLSYKKKCMKKTIKCLQCSAVFDLESLHCSQIENVKGSIATAVCPHCNEIFTNEEIASHEEKCRVRCPKCLDVVLLKNWQNHKCDISRTEDENPLCDDLKKMLLNGLNHDLILKVGDKELKAHQDILRARSQVFESMLSHDTKEKRCGIIDIPDCDPDAMEQFLSYIYSGKVDKLEENNMIKLYYIADKYDIKGLKEKCSSFIKKSVSATNFCEIIQLALNHSDTSLLEHATEYFINNDLEIMHTVEWQVFMKGNSTVANELTIKTIRKLRDIQI